MAMTLIELLNNGGSLRFRQPHGFYVVRNSERHSIEEAEAVAAIKNQIVRPEGADADIHGVRHFVMNKKKTGAKTK